MGSRNTSARASEVTVQAFGTMPRKLPNCVPFDPSVPQLGLYLTPKKSNKGEKDLYVQTYLQQLLSW